MSLLRPLIYVTRIGVACIFLFFGFVGIRGVIGPLDRDITLPNDYLGRFTIVEAPDSGIEIPVTGFWSRHIDVRIPESGLLAARNLLPVHWLARETIKYADGRILSTYGIQRPEYRRVQHVTNIWRAPTPAERRWVGDDSQIHTIEWEVLSEIPK